MNIKKILTSSLIGIFAVAILIGVAAASISFTSPAPFTAAELSANWEADRMYPTGEVTSVTAFGRTDVARIGIDRTKTAFGGFYRTEGIKTKGVQSFGNAVQVDLYIDPDWENKAVRAGFWVVGDNGAGARDGWFGVIEFVNSENCDEGSCSGTHPTNRPNHEGFRIWDSSLGWTEELNTKFDYGKWVTLGIELDPEAEEYIYFINGEKVGTAHGGQNYISEMFLNSYNYGLDEFPTLSSDSYAAHWHVGGFPTSKNECKDGGWETFSNLAFKNQGDCVSYVQSNENAGKRD